MQQPLVEASKGDEGEDLDRDSHKQPADVQVRQLARGTRQFLAVTADRPEREKAEGDADYEPDDPPDLPAPHVWDRHPGWLLAQGRALQLE